MNNKGLLTVPLFFLLTCNTGCVVNKAISASAVANNLAVEKAQNEMLLLNVLRAKDHLPMYVTGISKINGQVKAEASLGVTIPFGSVGEGSEEITHYEGAPSATYGWNPNFDVNVFDTSEFMSGFLRPLDIETIKLYLDEGFESHFFFHLLVQHVQVRVEQDVCHKPSEKPADNCRQTGECEKQVQVDEYIFRNNQESGPIPYQWMAFAEWMDYFVKQYPHVEERKPEPVGPPLSKGEAVNALIKGLKEGFILEPAGKDEFKFQRLPSERWVISLPLELGNGTTSTFQSLYEETIRIAMDDVNSQAGGVEVRTYRDLPSTASSPDSLERSIRKANGCHGTMTVTLYFRSPESALYYLGEHARYEQNVGKVFYICMFGELQPMFVVLSAGQMSCKGSVEATTGDGDTYFIPAGTKPERAKCDGKTPYAMKDLSCDPGRSLHALTVVSQLIALQKSAKDLPTTSVVRVLGQ